MSTIIDGTNGISSAGYVNATTSMTATTSVTATTTVSDAIGNVRVLPTNAQSSSYTLVLSDAGKLIDTTSGGVTVPSGIFSAGQTISIYNDSSSTITITQGTSVTMYLVGTASTGNRSLTQRGVATVICVGSNTFVITGGGLS